MPTPHKPWGSCAIRRVKCVNTPLKGFFSRNGEPHYTLFLGIDQVGVVQEPKPQIYTDGVQTPEKKKISKSNHLSDSKDFPSIVLYYTSVNKTPELRAYVQPQSPVYVQPQSLRNKRQKLF